MIRNTFCILSGIGEKSERKLWERGILTWEDFMDSERPGFISPARKSDYDENLVRASEELALGNSAYFGRVMQGREHWRLFRHFAEEAVCLDIETNGFSVDQGGYATVVGLYGRYGYREFIRGRDLTADCVLEELSRYRYLITFFGSVFDVPFLTRALPGFASDMPHFDLCFGARKLGLGGGLKAIERTLGIVRDVDTQGMDGYDAVHLWTRAKRGDGEALDLLVRYNREDTVNLMGIAETVYRGLRASTGIEEYLN